MTGHRMWQCVEKRLRSPVPQERRDAITRDEHRFYGEHMVTGTPEQAIAHFQCLVDAGLLHFIVHTRADPGTARLLTEHVLPALTPAQSLAG
jgi:alkanesulfonate monooxygenase SsuD/methylene tetrahydromethanopterin reductase-like flavin-dependent oxidoreductase (luciferase family)